MRTLRTTLAAATATLATTGLLAVAAPAAQAAPAAEARAAHGAVLGFVTASGDTATITGRYRCFGGVQAHLWASIKQGPQINGTDQTSSEFADSWYDTNYKFGEQPQGMTVPCDGAWHTESFTLKRVFETPWGATFDGTALKAGQAWVQFCLVPSEENDHTSSSFAEFKNVKLA